MCGAAQYTSSIAPYELRRLSLFALRGELPPLLRQAFVLLLYCGVAIGEPLTFIGSRAVIVEAGAVLLVTKTIRIIAHDLILGFAPDSLPDAASISR
jgi:hypothetical protein